MSTYAQALAQDLVHQEMDRQNRMWSPVDQRRDTDNRELMHAGIAQLAALNLRQEKDPEAFTLPPLGFPKTWSGFRDYGSDIANLVVAAAFIVQEIARKLGLGEDATRSSRNPVDQPYTAGQPALMEP